MEPLLLLTLFPLLISASEPFHVINCPEFDEELAKQLEPNKQYFNDNVRVRINIEPATDEEIYQFLKQFELSQRQIKLTNNKQLAADIGAPLVYTMQYHRDKYFGRPNHITTHHVPANVVYRTPHGILAGQSRGEFGGELVFIDNNDDVTILQDINVEDIYQFDFGYVVTSGLNHMTSDQGMTYLVTFLNDQPHITKFIGLIGAPKTSLKLKNGDLLINSKAGDQVLRKDGSLIRVNCSAN